jgi:hypothetical protein
MTPRLFVVLAGLIAVVALARSTDLLARLSGATAVRTVRPVR